MRQLDACVLRRRHLRVDDAGNLYWTEVWQHMRDHSIILTLTRPVLDKGHGPCHVRSTINQPRGDTHHG
jgi:hypothetical protein